MNAMDLTLAMQPGWNLGNTFDATGGETSWGNPKVTKELLLAIRDEGFKSIRIPVTWDIFIAAAPGYTINPTYMERVREVVDQALDAGFIVMINMHHDSRWLYEMPSGSDMLLPRFRAVWEQISETFKDYPGNLIFEAINEPRFSEDWGLETSEFFDITDRLNNEAYEIIRASGGQNSDRKIVMETLVGGITETKIRRLKENILAKNDPNLIASVHYYGFWPFSVNVGGKTRFTDEVSSEIDKQMKLLHELLISDGIPVILGEYGLLGFDLSVDVIQQGEKLKFFDYLVYTADQYQITTMLWDNGQHFDRSKLFWRDPMLPATILQAIGKRSSQTEFDTLYLPPGEGADASVSLILNGNQPVAVALESGRRLSEGRDYELSDETLILKAAFVDEALEQIPASRVRLSLSFDSGPDWLLTLVRTGEAHLEEKQTKAGEFLIPASFEGEEVERIRAVSSSGENVSAQNWSSYLTYSEEYEVNHNTGRILITVDLLNRFSEGDLYLTVEMRSGLKLPYVLTKTADGIYGAPGTTPPGIEEADTSTSESEESKDKPGTFDPKEIKPSVDEDASDGAETGVRQAALIAFVTGVVVLLGASFVLFRIRKKGVK